MKLINNETAKECCTKSLLVPKGDDNFKLRNGFLKVTGFRVRRLTAEKW